MPKIDFLHQETSDLQWIIDDPFCCFTVQDNFFELSVRRAAKCTAVFLLQFLLSLSCFTVGHVHKQLCWSLLEKNEFFTRKNRWAQYGHEWIIKYFCKTVLHTNKCGLDLFGRLLVSLQSSTPDRAGILQKAAFFVLGLELNWCLKISEAVFKFLLSSY